MKLLPYVKCLLINVIQMLNEVMWLLLVVRLAHLLGIVFSFL